MLRNSLDVPGLINSYGFSKSCNNLSNFDEFCVEYQKILAKRDGRWNKYMKNKDIIEKSKKLKRFVRKGVPTRLRRQVWMAVSGAAALMDSEPNLYSSLLNSEVDHRISSQIDNDVPRTFPENDLFQNEQPSSSMLPPLRNVLRALAIHNPKIGYCQGLNYIAGVLLIIVKSEEETFWLLNTLTTKIVTFDYYTPSLVGVQRDCYVLNQLLKENLPAVHSTLESQNINLILLCTKWFICLFCDILPIETLMRVFDCLFYEGDKILFRVAMTLIYIHKKEIAASRNFPEVISIFKAVSKEKSSVFCHEFMEKVFKHTKVTRKEIERLRQKYTSENENGD